LCGDAGDVTVSEAADTVADPINHNGSIDVETSQHNTDSLAMFVASSGMPLSPGSPSMRHSASDSVVYRADADLVSSCAMLPDCLHTEQVPISGSLNGYCKAVDESQVCILCVSTILLRDAAMLTLSCRNSIYLSDLCVVTKLNCRYFDIV